MPAEQIYQPQVAPGGTAGIPLASPQDFGAGVGQGIAELGGAMHRRDLNAYKIERQIKADQEQTDASAKFAELRAANDVTIDQRKNDPNVGPAGMTGDISKMLASQRDSLLGGINENSTRQALTRQFDEYQASTVATVDLHERGALIKKSATDFQATLDISRNRIASSDPKSPVFEQEGVALLDSLHSLNLPLDVQDKLAREIGEQHGLGRVESMVAHGQAQAALVAIDHGIFDKMLTPEQRDWARRRAETEIHVVAAAARADQQHALQVQKEALATKKAWLDTGAGTPQDYFDLAKGYEAIGDTSSALTARAKGAERAASLVHRGDSVEDMESRLSKLTSKQASGGLSVPEAAEYNGLKSLHEQTVTRLAQPGGALAQYEYASGKPLPALDMSNPASITARTQAAVAAANLYSRADVQPLLGREIPGLRDLANGSPAQQLQALQAIGKFTDQRAIQGAAKQIANESNAAFRIAATLVNLPHGAGAPAAADILSGPKALAAYPNSFVAKDAKNAFAAQAAPVLHYMPPGYADDVMTAATNLYATRWTGAGHTTWNKDAFGMAVDVVLGMHRLNGVQYGGRTTIGGLPVVVPPTMTPEGMTRRFARANGGELMKASSGIAPKWPDGSPVYSGEIRALTPFWVGGTQYGFLTRNGRPLGAANGKPFTVDVSKLPAR